MVGRREKLKSHKFKEPKKVQTTASKAEKKTAPKAEKKKAKGE